ncbi:MAG: TIGR02996 domain-containing protein [Gemmataceae bacterium]
MSGGLQGSFLEDIVAHVDDDTPRLVYADWLTENGQDDRAEFIRVQVERARLPVWDPGQVRLRVRERQLLAAHGEEWLAEMPAIKGVRWEGFRRGIVAEVSFASYEAMRTTAPAVRAAAPIEAVTVHWPSRGERRALPIAELRELVLTGRPYDEEVAWLADSPQLSTLRSLTVLGLAVEDLTRLTASPHLGGLRVLRLPSNGLGNAGVRALTQAATLTALEEIDLTGPGYYASYYDDPIINVPGAEALASWPGLATVRTLTLTGSDVRRNGLRALLQSPYNGSLKVLSLRSGRLDPQAVAAFRDARDGLRLEALDLGDNALKEPGVIHLASAKCLSELRALLLDRCELPASAPASGWRRRGFSTPCGAEPRSQPPRPDGPGRPAASSVRRRSTCCICATTTSPRGSGATSRSPASDGLLELDVSGNRLGVATRGGWARRRTCAACRCCG